MSARVTSPVPHLSAEKLKILEQICDSGEELSPALLRKVIPDRARFEEFLAQRNMTAYPAAKRILAALDRLESGSVRATPEQFGAKSVPSLPLLGKVMSKAVLVRTMAERLNITSKQVAATFGLLATTAIMETRKNGEFTIPGIGKLLKAQRSSRAGRNPQTGETIKIKAKTVVRFRVAKEAQRAVAQHSGRSKSK